MMMMMLLLLLMLMMMMAMTMTTTTTTMMMMMMITFINKKTKNTFLIDMAVPHMHNLAKTITDKQNKYQELANEICAMWEENTAQVIPLVISPTGVIPKSLPQSLKRLNLHPNTYIQMPKSVILGTCLIVRKF
jgi:NAD dependent epimerase/dehydratase family enzyme